MEEPFPPLTLHGLLAPGIHPLTLDQIGRLFGRFQRTDRRPRLFDKLREYMKEVRSTGWDVSVIVDGSFVMPPVDDPGDIDLIVVLPADWDMAAALRPFEYNLLSEQMTRRLYGFDAFAVRAGSEEERRVTEFFAQVNVKWLAPLGLSPGATKGLARVVS